MASETVGSIREAVPREGGEPGTQAAGVPQPGSGIVIISLLVLGLALTSFKSYLLFHSLVELFTVAVGWSTFFLAWNARKFLDNHYVLLLGIASLFVGAMDVLHLLSYQGLNIFPGHHANFATQFWIGARFLYSGSLLAAPLLTRRKLNTAVAFAVLGGSAIVVAVLVFTGLFPTCYVAGTGLTAFKTAGEYVIVMLLAGGGLLLYRTRGSFEASVWKQLELSLALTVSAELFFTDYINVYGPANFAGHLLRFIAACVLYRAIIVTGLVHPYGLLFRNLARSEEALRISEERYRSFVWQTSEGIVRFELDEPMPVSLPENQQVDQLVRYARVAECNDAYARTRGAATAAEMIGGRPIYLELLRAFIRSGYRMPAPEVCETEVRGERRWISGHFTGMVENGCLVRFWGVQRDVTEFRLAAIERERLIGDLQRALAEVKTLSGLLPICANCKKIRDDKGYWMQVEHYITQRTDVSFSHGICPDCLAELYPDYSSGEQRQGAL